MGLGNIFDKFTKRKTEVSSHSTLTPEQNALLQQLISQGGKYIPQTYGMLADFMAGNTGLGEQQIENFYQQGVLQPALYEFNQYVRPQIEEQFGNRYHSSVRTGTLSRAFGDLMNQMAQTRANLQYQGLLQNIGLRQWGATGLMNMIQQPLGVKAIENVASQQASPFDILAQLGGTAGTLMGGYGLMQGSGK